MLLLIAAAAMAAATPAPDPAEARARRDLQRVPAAVRHFVERRANCNHWGGEEPYDAERRAEIGAAVRKLRCERIDADERRIKRKYGKSPRVRRLLVTTREWYGL